MKAVIYARYSSEKQTEQSIEGQLHICNEFAKRAGYTIVENYIDRAMSGRTDKRENFQRMIKDSEKHTFEAVIVYKLDRFSRDRFDSAFNKKLLKNNGVRVVSATENISENPEGILLESLLEGLAEYFSAELSQKVTRGMRESVLKGYFLGGQKPYGYDVKDKMYVINPAEAEVVKQIYTMYLEKPNVTEICDKLNAQHIYNKSGKPFKHHQIINILTKTLYMGKIQAMGLEVEGKVPAIISKEQFMRVQQIAATKSHTTSNVDFMLLGKIFCGDCGKNMTASSGTGRSRTYYYYECRHDKTLVNKDVIEHKVCEAIKQFLENATNSTTLAVNIDKYITATTSNDDEKNIQAKIKKIDRELDNIANAVANGIFNDSIRTKNEALLEEKTYLIEELDKIKSSPINNINGNSVCAFLASLAKSDAPRDIKLLFQTLLHKVIIKDGKAIIILNASNRKPSKTNTKEFVEIVLNHECSTKHTLGVPKKKAPSGVFLFGAL